MNPSWVVAVFFLATTPFSSDALACDSSYN